MANSLLPKSYQDFSTREYWSDFFQNRGSAFEWYGEYPNVQSIWQQHVQPTADILCVGCGNSAASAQLFDDGFKQIVNIDFVDQVIVDMRALNKEREGMTWETMDMTKTTFADSQFDVVFDKGAMDALFATESAEDVEAAVRMIEEIKRVGTKYFCITLAQDHIVQLMLDSFVLDGWALEIHQPDPASFDNASPLFPFVFIATRVGPDDEQPLAICLFTIAGCEAQILKSDQVADSIRGIQDITTSKHKLCSKLKVDELVRIELWDADPDRALHLPRFTCTLADLGRDGATGSFGVFIVPRGKEQRWQFVSEEGIRQLVEQIGMTRLCVVTMQACHDYESMQHIQDELSAAVEGMAPPNMKLAERIPFLSTDEGIGASWTLLAQEESEMCGMMMVEEQPSFDGTSSTRRLIFAANRDMIQSESRFLLDPPQPPVLDAEFTSHDHHKGMSAGLTLVQDLLTAGGRMEVVGLGGGALAMFLRLALPANPVTVVELDQCVLDLAVDWFGFTAEDPMMTVHVMDGLELITAPTEDPPAVIIVDVDSKDLSQGISAPPASFLELATLEAIRARLGDQGMLTLNFACRCTSLKEQMMERLRSVFGHVRELILEEDVNTILFCFVEEAPAALASNEVLQQQCEDMVCNDAFAEGVFERLNLLEQLEQLEGVEFDKKRTSNRGPRNRKNKSKKKR